MPDYKPTTFGLFAKGMDASTGVLDQPKGSFPRGSNVVLGKRGSLRSCDGSLIVNAYKGLPTLGRGRAMCEFFYQPTGVAPYYLRLMPAVGRGLGAPLALAGQTSLPPTSGGSLHPNQTYFYRVTALDGAGGETPASAEMTATTGAAPNLTVSIQWPQLPHAAGYNVYRSTSPGQEVLLTGPGLPVGPLADANGLVKFIDNGSDIPTGSTALTSAMVSSIIQAAPGEWVITATFSFSQAVNTQYSVYQSIAYNPGSNAAFDAYFWTIIAFPSNNAFIASAVYAVPGGAAPPNLSNGAMTAGGQVGFANQPGTGPPTITGGGISPPTTDTTAVTGLYAMPPAANGPAYSEANLVALFPPPAPSTASPDGGAGGGGGGGQGGSGCQCGGFGQQGATPSGGIAGAVSLIPQIVQFVDRAIIALGNGVPLQMYADPSYTEYDETTSPPTAKHPFAPIAITSVTGAGGGAVDSTGTVLINTALPHGLAISIPNPSGGAATTDTVQAVGASVLINGVADPAFNSSPAVVVRINSPTQLTVQIPNAIGHAASSGGILQVTSRPVISTFVPVYPAWSPSTTYSVGSIVVPGVVAGVNYANGYYYKCIQAGTSGTSGPGLANATTPGQQVVDHAPSGSGATDVIWQCVGKIQNTNSNDPTSPAPPPPGAGHICVYAGSLWVFNTWRENTANGLDGPCALRMSSQNNPDSWNPVNSAFLDKDDGTEGMGLATFTIAAQGIPPEGSLVALKEKSLYQIVGVFGSSNFSIARGQTDMGTIAPRTVLFVPGFGITRLSHLGWAVFDGMNDRVVSTQVEPYFIGSNDPDDADITVIDNPWMALSQSALTQNPPMYVTAIPVGLNGSSRGALTRMLCFDLVLKAWTVVDLPFPISTMAFAVTTSTIMVTIMGSYSDGTLQRWQAGDVNWATSVAGSQTPAPVSGFVRVPTVTSRDAYQRLYCRRVVVTGQQSPAAPVWISITPRNSGKRILTQSKQFALGSPLDFTFQAGMGGGVIGRRFDAIVNFTGPVTLDAFSLDVSQCPAGVPAGAIA